MYENVIYYLQANGWLDTVLNSDWEVDAFQFYAGDLFDIVSTALSTDFSPRAILDGRCTAQKDNLHFKSAREFETNAFSLAANYKCSLKGTNLAGSTVEVLRFTAATRIYIVAGVTTRSLTFKIRGVQVDDLSF